MHSVKMEESGQARRLKKRTAENDAAITQEQMTAFQRATQINGRDIHGNLAFNHNNQTPSIAIHYHNGVPTIITHSPSASTSGQAPLTPKTAEPEITRPLSVNSQDGLPSPSGSGEDHQEHADTERLTKASQFVEIGLKDTQRTGREKGIQLHSLGGALESTPRVHNDHGIGDQRQQVMRRRKLYGGLIIVVLLIISGIITGIVINERKQAQSAAFVLPSKSSTQIAMNTTGVGTASSAQISSSDSSQMLPSTTSQSSEQVNIFSESFSSKMPSSNTASTTSDQTLSTSYTAAMPASSCTSNCQAPTTPSSTPIPSTSAKPDPTSQVPPIIATSSSTTSPKSTITSKPVFCTTDGQCSGGQQCDYTASTCHFCTYATLGERCSGGQYNCCDPWQCIVGNDAYSTCISVS